MMALIIITLSMAHLCLLPAHCIWFIFLWIFPFWVFFWRFHTTFSMNIPLWISLNFPWFPFFFTDLIVVNCHYFGISPSSSILFDRTARLLFNWDSLHATLNSHYSTWQQYCDIWTYGRFIEIQNNIRRQKLHRKNQGSNFLGGSFSNRHNIRFPIQFRKKSTPVS